MIYTDSDDGVRLWIDGQLVIDNWTDHAPTIDTAICDFKANSRHTVKMEYYQGQYGAVARLRWRNAGSSKNTQFCFNSETGKCIDYFFLNGPSLDNVVHQYRTLTGKAPMLPKWAYGYWQSKEKYNTQDELLSIDKQYREKKFPIDCIVQDWYYWSPYPQGSHQFDEKRYPDITATLKQLHKDNFHIMLSVWAKFDPGSANYDALSKAGYLYPSDWGRGFYDAFNPKAGSLYWQQINNQLFTKGFDGWWLDASEPELDMNAFRFYNTAAGKGADVLNAYPLEHTGNVYRGQRDVTSDKRVVILTRSAFTGQQRNSAITWSGDIAASWKVFADQIPAGLNFNLSGLPYWTTDTGGFFVSYPGGCDNPEYRELYARWFQFSVFCPIFRSHGTNTPREMWQFGSEIEQVLLKYDNLRYRLLPYIYSMAGMVTQNDYTMMRALPMDFTNDTKVRNIADQFMFGPSIMACPVLQYKAPSRSVYLPKGSDWFDFWTGTTYTGGKTIKSSTPINIIPLYVKSGSIVPFGPTMQYTTEKPADPIELRIYPGADGSFTLYEDENDNYNYEKGRYATISFNWHDADHTLTIDKRIGDFPGMLTQRTFHVVVVKTGHGTGEGTTQQADKIVQYDGNKVLMKM
jgi:alpha-D-xyloside xylohydrolase